MAKTFALITGASSGIGYAYAREMAARHYNLFIVSNEAEALAQKAEILRKDFGVEVIDQMMDLGEQTAAENLYYICKEKDIEIEVLINNAGVYHDRDFLDDSAAFNKLILNLHVFTPAILEY